jgi:hypothetical protein
LNSFSCKYILLFLPSNMAAVTWSCKPSINIYFLLLLFIVQYV